MEQISLIHLENDDHGTFIRNFPALQEDELLYSGLCRYCHDAYDGVRLPIFRYLLGTSTRWLSPYFGTNLGGIADRVGNPHLTAKSLMQKHTCASVFLPFLPESRQKELFASVCDGDKSTTFRFGAAADQHRSNRPLRFCLMCLVDDVNSHGYPFWHCSHNLPGVHVCHKHSLMLQTTCPICGDTIGDTKQYLLMPLGMNCSRGHPLVRANPLLSLNETEQQLHIRYSVAAADLAHFVGMFPEQEIATSYRQRINQLNFSTTHGVLKHVVLTGIFMQTFPLSFISQLGLRVTQKHPLLWLCDLANDPYSSCNPIMHLLLILFLFGNIKALYEYEPSDETHLVNTPMQEQITALFQCFNPVCPNYLKSVINGYTETGNRKSTAKNVEYRCACGFVYYRHKDDANSQSITTVLKYRIYGHLWEKTLADVYRSAGGNIKLICERMHTNSPRLVNMHLERLGIIEGNLEYKQSRTEAFSHGRIAIRNAYCNALAAYTQNHPETSRTAVRRKFSGAVAYLSKHDPRSLQELLPARTPSRKPTNDTYFSEKDEQLLRLAKEAYEKEMKLIPPVRITRNRIMNRIPKTFPDRKDTCRYPLTAYFLNTCGESVENFYMRRLRYAIHYFLDEGSHPYYTKVIVKSGITWAKIDVYRDRINRMIDDALAENLRKDRGNLNAPS